MASVVGFAQQLARAGKGVAAAGGNRAKATKVKTLKSQSIKVAIRYSTLYISRLRVRFDSSILHPLLQ